VAVELAGPLEKLGVATHIRTTLLVSSLQSLRKRGSFADYMELLPPEHHAAVSSMIAGQWVPIEVGLAHYQACQGLAISRPEVVAIGRAVGDSIHGTFLATMVRMAGQVGVTPWTGLSFVERLFRRLFKGGGGSSVIKQGPKDALVVFAGMPVARVPYYRVAMTGVFEAGLDLFCRKSYVSDVPDEATATTAVVHAAWA
jgi:hypothetical protein